MAVHPRTELTLRAFVVAAVLAALTVPALGAPSVLNVQGVVRDTAGDPATGTFSVRFGLYAEELGGTELWSEIVPELAVEGGVFAAQLGHSPDHPLPAELFADTDDVWLGVRVEAQPELPRQRLVSVPYALAARQALTATSALGLDCAGCVPVTALGFDPATQAELDALRANPLAGLSCNVGYLLVYTATGWACTGDYVTWAALTNYVTEIELTGTLANYVSSLDLAAVLENYPTLGVLASTLGSYVTASDLAGVLEAYATTLQVTSMLSLYVTTVDLADVLNNYVTHNALLSQLSLYVTQLDLSGVLANYVTNGALTSALGSYVTQSEFNAALAELGPSLGELGCGEGEVPVFEGGAWQCGTALTELPPDGLDEISNNLLTNQFDDETASPTTPVAIPDGLVGGVVDTLTFPDLGIAQQLTVALHLTNSDLPHLRVVLTDPAGVSFVLWCGNGVLGFAECTQTSAATEIHTTYPPTAPALGNLSTWHGRNPAGQWALRVIDLGDQPGTTDGQILAWSVRTRTLSNQQVEVMGDLIVDGEIRGPAGLTVGGPGRVAGTLTVGGATTLNSGLTVNGGAGITGGLTVTGSAQITGDLTVNGHYRGTPPSLDCTTVSVASTGTTATATCATGYTVTGGGCNTTPSTNGVPYASQPSGNGWYCQESDAAVTAYAVCCRILWP